MAAVAAAVLAVSLGSAFWYRPKLQSVVSETATGALQGVESPVEVTRQPEAPRPSLRHEPRRLRARAFSHGGEDFEALPEVMVFPEERAAFARFVAELPREQEEAVALTGAAPSNDELTAEIMALEIESLEVKYLDPGWE